MSNFLDLEPEDTPSQQPAETNSRLREMLASVPIAAPPTRRHPKDSDKLAAVHGFTSREATLPAKLVGGRRAARGLPAEDTRQLSIRMPVSLYNDFLAYADRRHMTYNEAIRALLDKDQVAS